MNSTSAPTKPDAPVPVWVQRTVWGAALLLVLIAEAPRWLTSEARIAALQGWLADREANWLPYLPLLLLAPVAVFMRTGRSARFESRWQRWLNLSAREHAGWLGLWLTSGFVFLLALWLSVRTNREFATLPPAYHDEYSYLLQAETFLAGRFWYPSFADVPEIFDQVHVLNEGKFASRYFPGTGLWIAPFLAAGIPWAGQQLAHALIAMLLFWIGRELSSHRVGLLAGLLYACAPGPLLFSTLLLAHQPTLLGLMVFLWAFLRWQRTLQASMVLMAGCGLAWAMLCRPMTAAGFALPFGIAFVWWWLGKQKGSAASPAPAELNAARRTLHALLLGLPLVAGMGFMMYFNQQITGSPLKSPYQLYTDLYTPRHTYGFNNVVRGEQHLGPKVLENYDRWAVNLTPALAAKNVWTRLESSLRWTFGIVPLLCGLMVVVLSPRSGSPRWGLIIASIVSLHLAHIPYWFDGILGWHYVYETAPLWILLFAEGTQRLYRTWRLDGSWGLTWLWRMMIFVAVLMNLVTVRPFWPGRLPVGIIELQFPRQKYSSFRWEVEFQRAGKNAIVFVIPDPEDRHMDYVTNPPSLTGPVLVARLNDRSRLEELKRYFPNRTVIVYDAAMRQFVKP